MQLLRTMLAIGLVLALNACGGGGGSSDPPPPAPVANSADTVTKQWDNMKWDEGQWQ